MQQILNCQKCNKEIENKCLTCLEQELTNWRPTLSIEFSEKVENFKEKSHTEKPCITCSSRVNVCSSCFHTYIYNWLQEEYPELTEEFMAFFNIHD